LQYTTTFIPDESGDWAFSIATAGSMNLFFDGKLIIENNESYEGGESFFCMGSTEKRVVVKNLVKGQSYPIEARGIFRYGLGFIQMAYGLRIGAERIVDPQVAIDASADLASKSDLCIVIVGVTGEFETEGFDRKNME
jgi:beta-glucosidase